MQELEQGRRSGYHRTKYFNILYMYIPLGEQSRSESQLVFKERGLGLRFLGEIQH
jgi:hypothetical protein